MKNDKNPLNVTVSYFYSHKDQNPKEVNLYEFLIDGRAKEQVLTLRNESDPDIQRAIKGVLPACTVSGLFSGRSADSLMSATNLICIDIDAKDNDILDLDTLKERIVECPYVLFCAHSARGKGYFCIIQIADHKKFLGHFLSLERDFQRAGILVDRSCKDINRLRYAFYDPEPYINLDAVVYDRIIDLNKNPTRDMVNRESVPADKITNAYHIGLLAASLDKQDKDITENYSDWFNIACAIAGEFGEAGRTMFHDLSKNYDGYTPNEADFEYNKVLRYHYDRVPIGKIFNQYAVNNDLIIPIVDK